MSLVFRNVRKISKKPRRSRSKTKRSNKNHFSKNSNKSSMHFEREEFPPLTVTKNTTIFGTSIPFSPKYGTDVIHHRQVKTKFNNVAFMNEYAGKSFEELRWDDHQAGLNKNTNLETKTYSQCLAKSKFCCQNSQKFSLGNQNYTGIGNVLSSLKEEPIIMSPWNQFKVGDILEEKNSLSTMLSPKNIEFMANAHLKLKTVFENCDINEEYFETKHNTSDYNMDGLLLEKEREKQSQICHHLNTNISIGENQSKFFRNNLEIKPPNENSTEVNGKLQFSEYSKPENSHGKINYGKFDTKINTKLCDTLYNASNHMYRLSNNGNNININFCNNLNRASTTNLKAFDSLPSAVNQRDSLFNVDLIRKTTSSCLVSNEPNCDSKIGRRRSIDDLCQSTKLGDKEFQKINVLGSVEKFVTPPPIKESCDRLLPKIIKARSIHTINEPFQKSIQPNYHIPKQSEIILESKNISNQYPPKNMPFPTAFHLEPPIIQQTAPLNALFSNKWFLHDNLSNQFGFNQVINSVKPVFESENLYAEFYNEDVVQCKQYEVKPSYMFAFKMGCHRMFSPYRRVDYGKKQNDCNKIVVGSRARSVWLGLHLM